MIVRVEAKNSVVSQLDFCRVSLVQAYSLGTPYNHHTVFGGGWLQVMGSERCYWRRQWVEPLQGPTGACGPLPDLA